MVRDDTAKTQFLLDLFNDKYGVRCVVLTIYEREAERYIVLDSDQMNIPSILDQISLKFEEEQRRKEKDIDYNLIKSCLATMDTEFDKKLLSVILSILMKEEDLYICGLNATVSRSNRSQITEILDEIEGSKGPAEEIALEKVKARIKSLNANIEKFEKQKLKGFLSSRRQRDLDEIILLSKEQVEKEIRLLERKTPYEKQKFQQRVKRIRASIVANKRLKRRKQGAGAKEKLDSETEEYIAKAIETMCSAHGRRHDAVLYLNHRLKSKNLLSIANHNLAKRGKKLIKSTRTVMLRSRPKKLRTREAKRHKGRYTSFISNEACQGYPYDKRLGLFAQVYPADEAISGRPRKKYPRPGIIV